MGFLPSSNSASNQTSVSGPPPQHKARAANTPASLTVFSHFGRFFRDPKGIITYHDALHEKELSTATAAAVLPQEDGCKSDFLLVANL
jgi:hypothetical protein